MDFDKPNRGPGSLTLPGRDSFPEEDDLPAGANWFAWDLTVDAAQSCPVTLDTISVPVPGFDIAPSLATQLSWTISKSAK